MNNIMILQDLLCNEQLIINKSESNQQIQYNEFRNLFKMISTYNHSDWIKNKIESINW